MKQRNVSIIVYSTILILSTLILFLLLFSYREKIDEIFVSDNIVIGKDCRTNKYAFYTKQNNKYTKLREIEHNSTDKYFTLNTNPKSILVYNSYELYVLKLDELDVKNNNKIFLNHPRYKYTYKKTYDYIFLGQNKNFIYFAMSTGYLDNLIMSVDLNTTEKVENIKINHLRKDEVPLQILESYKNIEKYITKISTKMPDENYAKTEKKFSTYNNPIIPEGFHKVETKEASWKIENGIPKGWNNGLVIEDNIGNQFVWVPVNLDEYTNSIYLINANLLFNENNMEYDRDYDYQVIKYGGFYISRYEIGKPLDKIDHPKIISMKNKEVFNNITWPIAKDYATEMYSSDTLQSDLVSPKEWITMCKWIEKHGYDMIDSSGYGNYLNTEGKLNLTGSNEKYKTCNIYDIAGNVSEYADRHLFYKHNKDNYCYHRLTYGGSYTVPSTFSASNTEHYEKDKTTFESKGFRVVLYIKKF